MDINLGLFSNTSIHTMSHTSRHACLRGVLMFEGPPTKAHASMVKSGKTHKSFSLLNICEESILKQKQGFQVETQN
jgi:hypothetical protein